MSFHRIIPLIILCAVLNGCGVGPQLTSAPPVPGVKIGNPYKIDGKWYTPAANLNYNQVGVASWYGPGFHNKKTANGETYNMNALTAAHTTLPMPSYVRVTNLENNRSLLLKINDRGPFVDDRLIDVSRRGAQLLGFEKRGTTRVRVEAVEGPNAQVNVVRSEVPPPIQKQEVGRVDISSLEVIEPLQILVEPSQVISSTILPKDSGNTYIQVGAYSKIGSASRVMTAVSHLGDIGMESIQLNGRKIYRVRIGPLKSSDFASSTLAKILKLGHSMANVVID